MLVTYLDGNAHSFFSNNVNYKTKWILVQTQKASTKDA